MADGELIEVVKRLADLVETRIAPALERIAEGLSRLPASGTADDPRREAVVGVRKAIRAGDWAEARALAGDFAAEYPDAPETPLLEEAIRAGRDESAASLRGQIDAAHRANDADRILALRDELAGVLDPDPLGELDRQVIGWLMALIQKRLRVMPMPPDLPALAARVAESFAATAEGASLLRALPTLRRSAGLCPRCGRPYRGTADACPECLTTPHPAPS